MGAALLLGYREILVLDEHRDSGGPEAVFPDAVGDYARNVEQRLVNVFRIGQVFRKGPFRTAALGFRDFGLHGRIVPAVGVLMELPGEFTPDQSCERFHSKMCKLSNSLDPA